jgi:hypothetical protein
MNTNSIVADILGRPVFLRHFGPLISYRPVVLNLWVVTQNWVAENIPMGREYFIKITLFFILDEPLLINAKACGKENNIEISLHVISDVLVLQLVRGSRNSQQKYKRNLPIR